MEVDSYVSSYTATVGLGSISVRGSAATHFSRKDGQGQRRPAELEAPRPGGRFRAGSSSQVNDRDRGYSRERSRRGLPNRQRGRFEKGLTTAVAMAPKSKAKVAAKAKKWVL